MKIIECKQGTSDWFTARLGVASGSHCADILGTLKKGGENAARANYRAKIVAERLSGMLDVDGFVSPAMMWGTDVEPLARAAYEIKTGNEVDTIGFALHDSIENMGGSPDGLVGEDGIIEIKCGNTNTHLKWRDAGIVPPEHEPQISFYLALTGRKWADFISYDPRLPERHRIFVVRMERDDARCAEIEDAVRQFNAECDAMIARLDALNPAIIRPEMPEPEEDPLGLTTADLDHFFGPEE